MFLKDAPRVGIDLALPQASHSGSLKTQVEAADPGEQAAKSQHAPPAFAAKIAAFAAGVCSSIHALACSSLLPNTS